MRFFSSRRDRHISLKVFSAPIGAYFLGPRIGTSIGAYFDSVGKLAGDRCIPGLPALVSPGDSQESRGSFPPSCSVALWVQTEVCKGHTGILAEAAAQKGGASSQCLTDSSDRQKQYLKRSRGLLNSWRPVKRYRVSAKHFLLNLSNQATQGPSGLVL